MSTPRDPKRINTTPPNQWLAKVHGDLFASGKDADCKEIEAMFGQPGGGRRVAGAMRDALKCRFFEVTNRGVNPLRYKAVERRAIDRETNLPTTQFATSGTNIGRDGLPWPSVWAYASHFGSPA